MTKYQVYQCPRCGDIVTSPGTPRKPCSCGGTYQLLNKHDTIAYFEAKKARTLRGIRASEDRAIYGSVIFPDREPNYLAITPMQKVMNDEIRMKFGEKPRWCEL